MSAGELLAAVFAAKSGTGSFRLSASRSLPVAGAAYATVTVSTRCSSSASVSTAVAPLTETAFVAASATSRCVPASVDFTVNADAAGTDIPSIAPSKVTVSADPFTDADEYAGGVTLVARVSLTTCATLPERSVTLLAALIAPQAHTCTPSSCVSAS